ncbi:MAG TPA: hypothetical protein VK034_24045 [Enhygromyxa sp.]|nr:hypothetical protein [Enhygromyxa sp.]
MRDENEQPMSNEGRQADIPPGGHEPEPTLLADYERTIESAASDALCRVIARHPAATAQDLRDLLKAHPAIGEVTLAELFFEHAGDRHEGGVPT